MAQNNQASETVNVLRAIDGYTEAFQQSDMATLIRHISVPVMQIVGQEVSILNTVEEVQARYTALAGHLNAQGYSHSTWMERQVKLLGPATAMVSGAAIRYRTDGSELERIGATYLLRLTETGWKIVVATAHPPDAIIRPAPSP